MNSFLYLVISFFVTMWDNDDAMRSYVSALWAEDWDCAEDAVYDTL